MTVETFFANFGHLADAPNGVQKLRELILQLAVQGKLVPQDPSDEPASVLLERIEAEKACRSRARRASNNSVTADGMPHALPQGWAWVRLPDLGELYGGGTPSKNNSSFWGGDIPWVTPKDMKSDVVTDSEDKITEKAIENSAAKLIPPGSLLIVGRSGILKRTLPVCINAMKCTVNQDLKVLSPYLPEIVRFLQVLLKGFEGLILTEFVKGGMTVQSIAYDELFLYPFPLPPLEEQKRIVAKVDQLMALCDELEARRQKQQQGRVRLNNSALDALLTAREPDEFADHWQRISTNFDLLYDRPETITKLRAAILQLAVQGKLVPQESPSLWHTGVLGDVVETSEAGWSPQCENRPRTGEEWGVLKVSAVSWGRFDPDQNKALPNHLEPRPRWAIKKGDFLISRANTAELVAKSVVVDQSYSRLLMSDKIIRITFRRNADPCYFNLVNNSPFAREYYASVAGGTSSSMKNVSRQQILDLPVIIPPFEEQERIVVKVDQLMAVCDDLEAKLNQAQKHSEKLMEATVRVLLEGGRTHQYHTARLPHVVKMDKPAPQPQPAGMKRREEALPLVAEKSAPYTGNVPQTILGSMHSGREYSRAEILESTGIPESDWSWAIRQLKEQGRVVQKGERRGARYVRK